MVACVRAFVCSPACLPVCVPKRSLHHTSTPFLISRALLDLILILIDSHASNNTTQQQQTQSSNFSPPYCSLMGPCPCHPRQAPICHHSPRPHQGATPGPRPSTPLWSGWLGSTCPPFPRPGGVASALCAVECLCFRDCALPPLHYFAVQQQAGGEAATPCGPPCPFACPLCGRQIRFGAQ